MVKIWPRTLKRYYPDYKHVVIPNEREQQLSANGSAAGESIAVTEELINSQEAQAPRLIAATLSSVVQYRYNSG